MFVTESLMAPDPRIDMEKARRLKRLNQFAEDHPSEGDAGKFDALLDAMARDRPIKKPAGSG